MPRRYRPGQFKGPDFAGTVRSFLDQYNQSKQIKMQKVAQVFAESMAQQQFDARQEDRQFLRSQERYSPRGDTQIIGGQQIGYHEVTQPKPFAVQERFGNVPGVPQAQTSVRELIPPRDKPTAEAKLTIKTPEGVTITGDASLVQPYIDQFGVSEPKTKGPNVIGAFRSLETEEPAGFTVSPDGTITQTGGGRTKPTLPEAAARADSIANYERYGTFTAPGGQQPGGQQRDLSPPPQLQDDPEAQQIIEDFKNGSLEYEEAVDLLNQKLAEIQGQ